MDYIFIILSLWYFWMITMCYEVSYLYIGLLTQLSYLTYVGFLNRYKHHVHKSTISPFYNPILFGSSRHCILSFNATFLKKIYKRSRITPNFIISSIILTTSIWFYKFKFLAFLKFYWKASRETNFSWMSSKWKS